MFNTGDCVATNYELKYRLGGGSYGEVWLAHNSLADVDVAIKFYNSLDQNGVDEFRREFQLAYKMQHPNLLHLNHFDVYNNCPFLVMPYCLRGSVVSLIGKIDEPEIWRFLRDVSAGLMYLHQQRPALVHQDIKPDNILIGDDGRYMLSDFGISRKIGRNIGTNDEPNKQISSGTIAYMGPEHFSGNGTISTATDIWALGMSVYELVDGDVLWNGLGGSAQLNGSPFPTLGPQFSAHLNALVHQCLNPNPAKRPTAATINNMATKMLSSNQVGNADVLLNPKPVNTFASQPSYSQNNNQSYYSPIAASNNSSYSSSAYASNYPKNQPNSNQNKRQQIHKPHQSSNFNNNWMKISLWSVLGLLIIFGIGLCIKSYTASMKEDNQFYSCQTYEDYTKFVNDYPDSKHKESAMRTINKMERNRQNTGLTTKETNLNNVIAEEEKSDKTSIKGETTSTTNNQNDNSKIIIKPFKSSKPTDKSKVEEKPQKSKAQIEYEKERRMFNACKTQWDYENYMRTYPKGHFYNDARKAVQRIESEMMKEGNAPYYKY